MTVHEQTRRCLLLLAALQQLPVRWRTHRSLALQLSVSVPSVRRDLERLRACGFVIASRCNSHRRIQVRWERGAPLETTPASARSRPTGGARARERSGQQQSSRARAGWILIEPDDDRDLPFEPAQLRLEGEGDVALVFDVPDGAGEEPCGLVDEHAFHLDGDLVRFARPTHPVRRVLRRGTTVRRIFAQAPSTDP